MINHMLKNRWLAGTLAFAVGAAALHAADPEQKKDFDRIAAHLDTGGSSFQVLNAPGTVKVFEAEVADIVALLNDVFPDTPEPLLAAIDAAMTSGLFSAQGSGSSTKAIRDGVEPPRYLWKGYSAIDWQDSGWLLPMLFPANHDLSDAMKNLPDTTIAAVEWYYDAAELPVILADLELSDDEEDTIAVMAQLLTGRVEVVFFYYDEDSEQPRPGFVLSFPDPDGATPPFAEDAVCVRENGRLLVYPDADSRDAYQRKIAAGEVLKSLPEFAEQVGVESAVGFVFICNDLVEAIRHTAYAAENDDRKTWGDTFAAFALPGEDWMIGACTRVDDGVTSTMVASYEPGSLAGTLLFRFIAPALIAEQGDKMFRGFGIDEEGNMVSSRDAVSALKQAGLAVFLYESDMQSFPAEDGFAALSKLAEDGYLGRAEVLGTLKTIGAWYIAPVSDDLALAAGLPLIIQRPGTTGDQVAVCFRDGHVETFRMPRATTYKEVISTLHSNRQYPEAIFRKLIEKAELADKK